MGIIRIAGLLIILWGLAWYIGALEFWLWLTGAFVVFPIMFGFLHGYFGDTKKPTVVELRERVEIDRAETRGFKVAIVSVIVLIGGLAYKYFTEGF